MRQDHPGRRIIGARLIIGAALGAVVGAAIGEVSGAVGFWMAMGIPIGIAVALAAGGVLWLTQRGEPSSRVEAGRWTNDSDDHFPTTPRARAHFSDRSNAA